MSCKIGIVENTRCCTSVTFGSCIFRYKLKFPSKLISSTSSSSYSDSFSSLATSASTFEILVNRFVDTHTPFVYKALYNSLLVSISIFISNISSVYTRNISLYSTYSLQSRPPLALKLCIQFNVYYTESRGRKFDNRTFP